MNAIGYTRVSTEEQARTGASLDAQEDRIRAYCQSAGLDLGEVIREEGVSGSIPILERPQGRKLLTCGAAHVVAVKLDRLFRDAADASVQSKAWDKAGVALHIIDMGGASLNTRSAMGRCFLQMAACFAELERNLIAERTAAAMARRKAEGKRVGSIPYGYTLSADGELVSCQREHAARAYARLLREQRGLTFRAIGEELLKVGYTTRKGGTWKPQQVKNLLSS